MLDCVVAGAVFTSPTPDKIFEGINVASVIVNDGVAVKDSSAARRVRFTGTYGERHACCSDA